MSHPPTPESPRNDPTLPAQVGIRAARKLKARRHPTQGVWIGLGMMGLIGWSVVIPTLLGAALGVWVDSAYPSRLSWTLMLLLIGLIVGCVNAWHWVAEQDRAMREEQQDADR